MDNKISEIALEIIRTQRAMSMKIPNENEEYKVNSKDFWFNFENEIFFDSDHFCRTIKYMIRVSNRIIKNEKVDEALKMQEELLDKVIKEQYDYILKDNDLEVEFNIDELSFIKDLNGIENTKSYNLNYLELQIR